MKTAADLHGAAAGVFNDERKAEEVNRRAVAMTEELMTGSQCRRFGEGGSGGRTGWMKKGSPNVKLGPQASSR